jgi:glucose-1-phosphate thymidylyltransferase
MIENAILLAGGTGSRLYPLTHVVNKHLLGVHGQFIIDYPINTLKTMGVKNVTIVLGGNHFSQVVDHLKDGSQYQLNFNYVYQHKPQGIAQAISLCAPYMKHQSNFAVILGDNIFEKPVVWNSKSIAACQIALNIHPELHRFGVASIQNNKIIKIEEKPKQVSTNYSNYAITGCYLFDNQFFNYFNKISPSSRNEYEITDIINLYNLNNNLDYTFVDGLWSDAGTHQSIAYVNNYYFNKYEI